MSIYITMEIAPPLWQINIRKYPIGSYFHSSIYTMEIAPPQWTVNIENQSIGGYFHSNIVCRYSISVYNTHRYCKQYITMEIAPYWPVFNVKCPLRGGGGGGGYFHSIYTTMEIAPY